MPLRAVLLDLDGVLYVEDEPVEGAAEAVLVGDCGDGFDYALLNGAFAHLMVGDDVESDVGGALAAGLAGVLVRTGKFREDALRDSGVEPTAVAASIADVPALLGRLRAEHDHGRRSSGRADPLR